MADTKTQFAELSTRPYQDQATWFLNGFWKVEGLNGEKAEEVWNIVKTFQELAPTATELNEFDSHRLLEKYNETLSVIKMREALREIDQDNNQHST
jgi:hypothetical protein